MRFLQPPKSNRSRRYCLGQSTVEFALIAAFATTMTVAVVTMDGGVKETYAQKSNDIHARAEAYLFFENGQNVDPFDLDGVFLPAVDLTPFQVDIPGFDLSDIGIGIIKDFFANIFLDKLFDFLNFTPADGLVQNGLNYGASAYLQSGLVGGDFSNDIFLTNFYTGALQSAQFGRFVDNLFDVVYQSDGAQWVEPTKDFYDNISIGADVTGSVTQGYLIAVVGGADNGDAILAGLAQGWQANKIQEALSLAVTDEIRRGILNGTVTGTFQAAQNDFNNAGITILGSAASGGFMTGKAQQKMFGDTEKFFRGLAQAGTNAGFQAGIAYASADSDQRDAGIILAAAAISMGSYTTKRAYEATLKPGIDAIKQGIKDKAKEKTAGIREKLNSIKEKKDEKIEKIEERTKSIAQGTKDFIFGGDNDGVEETADTTEVAENNTSAAETTTAEASIVQEDSKATAETVAKEVSNDSTAMSAIAMALVVAAIAEGKDKRKEGKASEGGQEEEQTPKDDTSTLNLANDLVVAGTQDLQNSNLAKTNNDQKTSKEATNSNPPTQIEGLAKLIATKQGNVAGEAKIKLPHDVNIQQVLKSPLVKELKRDRQKGVNMVKKVIGYRLLSDYRRQLVKSGLPGSKIRSILNQPQTRERIQAIVDDPLVENAINDKLIEILDEENLQFALEAAKEEQIKMQALMTKLAVRERTRKKVSKATLFEPQAETGFVKNLLQRIIAATRKLGVLI